LQIGYLRINSTVDIYAGLYAHNAGGAEIVVTGIRTDVVANNWIIRTNAGAGYAHTDTGVAADTNYHWHIQHVYPVIGGHQIDYWLDGGIIGSHTANIPTVQMEPALMSYTVAGAAVKSLKANEYAVIPRGD